MQISYVVGFSKMKKRGFLSLRSLCINQVLDHPYLQQPYILETKKATSCLVVFMELHVKAFYIFKLRMKEI